MCFGSLAAAAALAWRIDVNLFSIYHFYRQRLVRCYLGASRCKLRIPHPFTGFDPRDDLKLADLCSMPLGKPQCQRPYPIHNTAMNLVAGKQLAWQERRAAAFAFTPLAPATASPCPTKKASCSVITAPPRNTWKACGWARRWRFRAPPPHPTWATTVRPR